MSDLIFDGLNEEQQRAVRQTEGAVLILAGAGSGKTKALTHRIAYLIEQGVKPWQILSVTFTNKAANEMRERITNLMQLTGGAGTGIRNQESGQSLIPNSQSLPVTGTFHSICVRILRRDIEHIGRNRDFVIYDANDQESIVKEILKEMNIDTKEIKPRTVRAQIGKFKCEAMSAKQVAEQATTDWMAKVVKMYSRYQTKLRGNNALDFDDLLLETVRLFTEVPDVLDRYQNTWRYLNVDEYQDTNHVQYLLISLLARKYGNLCVIGDPDQSIYAFRGADIRNILEFQHEYTNATSIKLERNYRSTQQILDAADNVIVANPNRPQKKMWTDRKNGEKIIVHEMRDEKEEAREAVHSAVEAISRGIPLREQVILYRTNAQSRQFEEACMRSAIPYKILGGVKFYARREVKDILSYLHAIHNPQDALSLLRIINIPSRKIGKATIGKLQELCQELGVSLWKMLTGGLGVPLPFPDTLTNRLHTFTTLLQKYQQKKLTTNVATLTMELLKEIKMEEWLKDGTSEGEDRWQNIGELLTVMHKYDGLEPEQSLVSFLEEVALVSEVDKLDVGGKDMLTLMTLHLCKGLEFKHVIIAGCEEGLFPHSNAMFDKEQLEEERRLMYVGMTRAKDELKLLHARSRSQWGNVQANARSRFLDDIPEKLVEEKSDDLMSASVWNTETNKPSKLAMGFSPSSTGFNPSRISENKKSTIQPYRQHSEPALEFNQDVFEEDINQDPQDDDIEPGTRIRHATFGEGIVLERNGDIAEILFDSGQKKMLALNIAPVEVLEKEDIAF